MDYKGQARITGVTQGVERTIEREVQFEASTSTPEFGGGGVHMGSLTRNARLTIADPQPAEIYSAEFLILEFDDKKLTFSVTGKTLSGKSAYTYILSHANEVGYFGD